MPCHDLLDWYNMKAVPVSEMDTALDTYSSSVVSLFYLDAIGLILAILLDQKTAPKACCAQSISTLWRYL